MLTGDIPAHSLYSVFIVASPTITIITMIMNTAPTTLLEYLDVIKNNTVSDC